jgi:ArsR family transcriptional regulator, arsenate/arsenite/antimonite-responsive transcriptional repressor
MACSPLTNPGYIVKLRYSLMKIATLTYDQKRLASMLKALGNPIRFQIIEFLAENQMCITGDIVRQMPLAQSTVSQHLKVLREAGLIQGEIDGPSTCYCINPQGIRWLKDRIGSWLPDCCPPEPENPLIHL